MESTKQQLSLQERVFKVLSDKKPEFNNTQEIIEQLESLQEEALWHILESNNYEYLPESDTTEIYLKDLAALDTVLKLIKTTILDNQELIKKGIES